MIIDNWAFFIRFLIGLGVLSIYVFFLIPKQLREITTPKDPYSDLRLYILCILLLTIVTLGPLVTYQLLISGGYESKFLRNFISIVGGINQILTTFLLVLIFKYKVKK